MVKFWRYEYRGEKPHGCYWSVMFLDERGEPYSRILTRLMVKHGLNGRLLVVDSNDEVKMLKQERAWHGEAYGFLEPEQMNVSSLYKILTHQYEKSVSLEEMLSTCGLKFEGRPHRADRDSYNIARLFLDLTRRFYNYESLPKELGC